jgi:hypothetical protein
MPDNICAGFPSDWFDLGQIVWRKQHAVEWESSRPHCGGPTADGSVNWGAVAFLGAIVLVGGLIIGAINGIQVCASIDCLSQTTVSRHNR